VPSGDDDVHREELKSKAAGPVLRSEFGVLVDRLFEQLSDHLVGRHPLPLGHS